MGRKDEQRILTSLPLEVLLYFNHYYTMLYVVFTVGLLMYKGMHVFPWILCVLSIQAFVIY